MTGTVINITLITICVGLITTVLCGFWQEKDNA
jgi:hypothetical protein